MIIPRITLTEAAAAAGEHSSQKGEVMPSIPEVTVSIRMAGDAIGNLRFDHPDECFIVEAMTEHGTMAASGFHSTGCIDEDCIASLGISRALA